MAQNFPGKKITPLSASVIPSCPRSSATSIPRNTITVAWISQPNCSPSSKSTTSPMILNTFDGAETAAISDCHEAACRTSGARSNNHHCFPALTDRANLCRPSGAGWPNCQPRRHVARRRQAAALPGRPTHHRPRPSGQSATGATGPPAMPPRASPRLEYLRIPRQLASVAS